VNSLRALHATAERSRGDGTLRPSATRHGPFTKLEVKNAAFPSHSMVHRLPLFDASGS